MKILFGFGVGAACAVYAYGRAMTYKLKREDELYRPRVETLEETMKRIDERRR